MMYGSTRSGKSAIIWGALSCFDNGLVFELTIIGVWCVLVRFSCNTKGGLAAAR
jgi:hypothetical protein